MDDAFVIAEVLTSSDYSAAAEALEREADGYEESLDNCMSLYTAKEADQLLATVNHCRARAERFSRVAQQVRQQELRAVGL